MSKRDSRMTEDDVLRFVAAATTYAAISDSSPARDNMPGRIAIALQVMAVEKMLSSPFRNEVIEAAASVLRLKVARFSRGISMEDGFLEEVGDRAASVAAGYISMTVCSAMEAYGSKGDEVGKTMARAIEGDAEAVAVLASRGAAVVRDRTD